jgi:hypothetical protein
VGGCEHEGRRWRHTDLDMMESRLGLMSLLCRLIAGAPLRAMVRVVRCGAVRVGIGVGMAWQPVALTIS